MQRSEQINELSSAMAKAQGTMKHAMKDSENPFFHSRYADFASVIDVAREPLSVNGLAVFQSVETDGLDVVITTLLSHSGGQWIETSLRLKPTKSDPQGVASAGTYGKRISYQALICIAADEDDDGNAASSPEQKPAAKAKPTASKPFVQSEQSKSAAELEAAAVLLIVTELAADIRTASTPEEVAAVKSRCTAAKERMSVEQSQQLGRLLKLAIERTTPKESVPSGEPTEYQTNLANSISQNINATSAKGVLESHRKDITDHLTNGELTVNQADALLAMLDEKVATI